MIKWTQHRDSVFHDKDLLLYEFYESNNVHSDTLFKISFHQVLNILIANYRIIYIYIKRYNNIFTFKFSKIIYLRDFVKYLFFFKNKYIIVICQILILIIT